MNCPKCKTETLSAFTVDDVTVDRCSSCAGVWFDARELNTLLAEESSQVASLLKGRPDGELDDRKGRCPRDGSELMRVYSAIDRSVVLDACGECRGLWLDGGEFKKLFAARRR